VRRSRPRLAFPRRHEVPGGVVTLCTVSPGSRGDGACMRHALLGGAEEPLLDGYLACDLPGLAVGDALAVARAPCVAALAMAPLALILVVRLPSAATSSTARAHPAFGGPPALGGRSRAAVTRMCVEPGATGSLGVRCGAEQVEAWPFLAEAGYPGGDPFFGRFNV
jgi:hypothetical protein